MGKRSEKHRTSAKKKKLKAKALRLICEGKKVTGKLLRYDHRGRKAA
jgi:hypothetical protein